MNRKVLLPGRFFLIFFVMLGFMIVGCNRGPKTSDSGDFEASGTIDAETQEQLNTAKRIFYSLPSPLETAMLIKNAGADYNEALMNPTANTAKYITSKSKALNLGIYSTDLSYASLFDQNQATLNYIEAAKAMADGLNILDVMGTGSPNGGVSGFNEVVGHYKNTGAGHSAVSIDANAGQDAIIYLAENGTPKWSIRTDVSDGTTNHLEFREHLINSNQVVFEMRYLSDLYRAILHGSFFPSLTNTYK